MNLVVMAIAPVAIILIYVYSYDKYEKEPLWLMALCVLAGCLSVLPILLMEQILSIPMSYMTGYDKAGWNAFVVAAFSEELYKFIAVMLVVWRSPHFNEKFDGIVYAVCVSMGFAMVENIMYVLESGVSTAYMRAITAVPAHAVMGITMGYFLGLAKMNPETRVNNLIRSLLAAIMIHGAYDFILMSEMPYFMSIFVIYVIALYRYGIKRMKEHSEDSPFKT